MKDTVCVGDRRVGGGEPAFIIAEAGSNHDQKLDQAKQLIRAAAESGADAVKFQIFAAADLYPPGTPGHDMVKKAELPVEWVPELAECSRQHRLLFFASVFSAAAVDCLEAVAVPVYKIASSETVNLPLLKYTASKHKPILLSTGMCDLADIHEALEVIRSEENTDIILLQCTSLYPTPPRHVHLRAMDTLRAAFHLPVGFSDHSMDILIPVAAVARGACVVEKHLTLSRTLPGPDHGYALEPHEFRRMVDAIRSVEEALGSPVKTMLPEEAKTARRLSLRARRDIQSGEILSADLLEEQRPGEGLRPRFRGAVVGRRARTDVSKGQSITWENL